MTYYFHAVPWWVSEGAIASVRYVMPVVSTSIHFQDSFFIWGKRVISLSMRVHFWLVY